jgi:hypothetical protein
MTCLEKSALLGALSDAEVAQRTGRSQAAVLKKCALLGRPAMMAQAVPYSRRLWRPEEDRAVRTLSVEEAAQVTGRTPKAVYHRKQYLRSMRKGKRRV